MLTKTRMLIKACMFIKACMALDSCMNGRKLAQVSLCQKSMAHFEQAALLATAWANDVEVKTMAFEPLDCPGFFQQETSKK